MAPLHLPSARRRALPLLVPLALTACAAEGVEPPAATSQAASAIIDGEEDHEHEAVALLFVDKPNGMTGCSATLVAPGYLLTAAHCVTIEGPGTEVELADVEVSFGYDWNDPVLVTTLTAIDRHPSYNDATVENDLALLRIAEAPPNVRPVPTLPASLALDTADLGQIMTFVGYGLTDPQDNSSGGIRMIGTAPLLDMCLQETPCGLARPWTLHNVKDPSLPCYGDSGGPALMDRGGTTYLVGVTSSGDADCEMHNYSVKVDHYADWIRGIVGLAQGQPCDDALECLSGFCVDAVCCDTACDDPCTACTGGQCQPLPEGTACEGGTCVAQECTPPDEEQSSSCQLRPGSGSLHEGPSLLLAAAWLARFRKRSRASLRPSWATTPAYRGA